MNNTADQKAALVSEYDAFLQARFKEEVSITHSKTFSSLAKWENSVHPDNVFSYGGTITWYAHRLGNHDNKVRISYALDKQSDPKVLAYENGKFEDIVYRWWLNPSKEIGNL
jgi:hypothetical protein